jgi:hypothetical protein
MKKLKIFISSATRLISTLKLDDLAALEKLKSEKVMNDLQFSGDNTPLGPPARIRFRKFGHRLLLILTSFIYFFL